MNTPLEFKSPYKLHCFVCTRCQDGQILRDKCKELVKERMPDAPVRINASGCLGMCDDAIAVAIYPKGQLLLKCRPEQAEMLYDTIKKELNQPIE